MEGTTRQLPPRTINVRKFAESRASEIESLHSLVAQRLGNNFRSQRNKRRRTTAHDNQVSSKRRRKRQKSLQSSNPEVEILDRLPRHIRRRDELRKNSESGFSTSGDGTKRLRTHAWHAKRFTMTKLWGFHLPLGLHGRGRGSRALLKRCREGVVVHDASYHLAVQLEGPEDSLISILSMALVSAPSGGLIDMQPSVLRGDTYGTAMLHHVGEPIGRPISPVVYMWRPLTQQNSDNSAQDIYANVHSEPRHSDVSKPFRQLWVSMHASAFEEGFNALKFACQKEMEARSIPINCFSLEGRIAKLELMGSNAFQLLQRILHPIPCFAGESFQLKKCSEAVSNDNNVSRHIYIKEEQFSDSAVMSLVVKDPRLCKEERVIDAVQSALTSKDGFSEGQAPAVIPSDDQEGTHSELKDLWDASGQIRLPVEDSVLCQEKHDRHMEFFCLSNRKSRSSNTLEALQSSRTCPIMLQRRHSLKYPFLGWSIILPLSWVKAFWIPLVTMGAHAIGLREKHWISSEAGIPYFPSDFPDCRAYTSLVEIEAAASASKADLRPPKLRPAKAPIPPPWNTIQIASGEVPHSEGNSTMAREIYIMRTSRELCLFNERFGNQLLLFPHRVQKNGNLQNSLSREATLYRDDMIQVKNESMLYFLRVSLHAFEEGAFEEGAVVCAPRLSDISLWTSRSGNDENGLQIPESAVASYFKEGSPGTWVLQTPVDPLVRERHRRAIGFVTSGFVRGSKKQVAMATCEATSLAQVRAEQWSETAMKRRKKKTYVLVRNLSSSAYRLALATLVLEHQEEDLESL